MVEPVTTAAGGAAAPEPSLWAQAQALLKDLPGLIGDRIELLSLELRRAGSVLVKIVALVVMAAILGVTAWLALWVAVGGVLVALGLHYLLALLIVLLINLGAAWLAVGYARKLATRLALPATMRHLTPSPSTKPPPVPPSAAPVPPPVPPTPAVAATPTPAPAAPLQPSTSASRS